MAFDQKEYIKNFEKEQYDKYIIRFKKGNKEKVQELAKLRKVSMNNLIIEAIENYYHIDISTKQDNDDM